MIIDGRREYEQATWPALLPCLYALAVAVYISIRYGFRWTEQDTTQFMQAIRSIQGEGTLEPSGFVYPHGYGYQTIVITLSEITGLSAARLQLAVMPFLLLVVALLAFTTFRLLTGNAVLGGLAALLLLVQPEFLFVTTRGTHEKVTYIYVLSLVFLLGIGLSRLQNVRSQAGSIIAYYLIVWSLITTTSFFSSSLIVSLALALGVSWLVLLVVKAPRERYRVTQRFLYAVLASYALLFLFIAYVYGPSQYNFAVLRTLYDQLSALFLSFEPQGDPYASLGSSPGSAWRASWIFPVLSAFNWFILAVSGITWLWLTIRLFGSRMQYEYWRFFLLWTLSAAFALQVAGSVVVDVSGFLGQNLQIRTFPLFMLFGIPLAVIGMAKVVSTMRPWATASSIVVGSAALMLFAAAGTLKATNDPVVSNKWLFYSAHEQQALTWLDNMVTYQAVWSGFDERLPGMLIMTGQIAYDSRIYDSQRHNLYLIGNRQDGRRYTVMSEVIQRQSSRLQIPAPPVQHDDRIYDNGRAQIYHRVPETPYQR